MVVANPSYEDLFTGRYVKIFSRRIMSTSSLVLMAAGLGSRFGGVKQLAEIGPNGESLMDYTIKDALLAGIENVIIIVRSEIAKDTESHLHKIHGDDLDFTFVFQDLLGPQREKPWGTAHAVLAAGDFVANPFVLANADDYYGTSSLSLAVTQLTELTEQSGALISFDLSNTLPASGSVTRGLCTEHNGELIHIKETEGLHFLETGVEIRDHTGASFEPATPVSMNLWCFHPSIMRMLEPLWDEFLKDNVNSLSAECLLPTCIASLMDNRDYRVTTIPSSDKWTGITNPEDTKSVKERIQILRAN